MHNPTHTDTQTYGLVGVRGDAQGLLQAAAVLVHAQGEVPVALVHRRHPLLDLHCVAVAFVTEAVRQLDQQLHALFGLLATQTGGQRDRHEGIPTSGQTERPSTELERK